VKVRRDKPIPDDADVHVVLETRVGPIEIAVFVCRAPLSSHAFLARVDDGSLSKHGLFYRAVRSRENDYATPPIDVLQGGLLDEQYQSLPAVAHENTSAARIRHLDGTVSLARGAVGSATGAAFFICLGDQPALDMGGERKPDRQGFAAFGRVIAGMNTVRLIHAQPTGAAIPGDRWLGQALQSPVPILRAWRSIEHRPPRGERLEERDGSSK
jgi:peptidyl-prolyl cis-trans isomerase A (cyclophilin A)